MDGASLDYRGDVPSEDMRLISFVDATISDLRVPTRKPASTHP